MRVTEIKEGRAVGVRKIVLAGLGLDEAVLVNIKLARIFLYRHRSAAVVKPLVFGIAAFRIELPISRGSGSKTHLPRSVAIPEGGDRQRDFRGFIIKYDVCIDGENRIVIVFFTCEFDLTSYPFFCFCHDPLSFDHDHVDLVIKLFIRTGRMRRFGQIQICGYKQVFSVRCINEIGYKSLRRQSGQIVVVADDDNLVSNRTYSVFTR